MLKREIGPQDKKEIFESRQTGTPSSSPTISNSIATTSLSNASNHSVFTTLNSHGFFASASSSSTNSSAGLNDMIYRISDLNPGAYTFANKGGETTVVAHGERARAVAVNNILEDHSTTVHTSSAEVATKALETVEKNLSTTEIIISNEYSSHSSSTRTNFNSIPPGPAAITSGISVSPGSA